MYLYLYTPTKVLWAGEIGMVSMSAERSVVRKRTELNNGQSTTGTGAQCDETPNHIVYRKVSRQLQYYDNLS